MPIEYRIDRDRRLVVASGYGELTDEDVFGYQREVWSLPEVQGFDEIVDMTAVRHIALPSPARVKDLAELSASMDAPQASSRFAIVAPDDFAFGLGRMFGIHRRGDERSTKQVAVFRSMAEALDWLGIAPGIDETG